MPSGSAALRAVTQQLIPGRWEALRKPTRKELAATAVLALPLTEASVKIRTGPPADDPDDLGAGVWAGVVPIAMTFGEPEPDAALRPGIAVPDHITGLGPAATARLKIGNCDELSGQASRLGDD